MTILRRSVVPALLVPLLALTACGGDAGADGGWAGTIDTLANGRVRVTSPERGAWREGEGWRLVEEVRIGSADEEGPALFGYVVDVEPDALGRLWVADAQAHEIRVFDADGQYVRTIGRKGGGPGEFQQIGGIERDPAGRMWTYDGQNARFSVFDTAGAFVTSHRRESGMMMSPWQGGFDARGRFYDPSGIVGSGGVEPTLVRYDSAMAPADTLVLPKFEAQSYRFASPDGSARIWASVPFAPGRVWTRSRAGGVWVGVGERYEIHHVTLDGDTTRTLSRPFTPVPVSAAEKDSAVARLKWFTDQGGKVDPGRIPSTKAAFDAIFEDDRGYLWVSPPVPGDAARPFDVFDPEGRYLGRVERPGPERRMQLMTIRGDRMYAMVLDEDGVNYVVRYRIEGREP